MEAKPLKQFDWIVINPPWLAASRLEGDSGLGDAVYDEGSLMLQNSIRLASIHHFNQKDCWLKMDGL